VTLAAEWLIGIALCGGLLYGLHRLGLWLDDRGWLYYRRGSRPGRWGLAIASIFDAEVRRIQEMQERTQVEEDDEGDPLRPKVRLGVTRGDEDRDES
jgi:hypothetical protein